MSGAMIKAGDMAPDFTLSATDGTEVTLSKFRGSKRVLLAFFPAAFTGTCTAEMCEFSDAFSRYADSGTVVLPISGDQLPALKAFGQHEKIKVPMLSDARREVSRAYGVHDEEIFLVRRCYVLVDESGKVRWVHLEDRLAEKRDTAELLEQVEALD
ncbi:MAG TPA: redoxin domain-containing protein [Gemmatimonadales bacterium]|nr:redoxin domain-containing protein [Gemmatimonadales bacterium]